MSEINVDSKTINLLDVLEELIEKSDETNHKSGDFLSSKNLIIVDDDDDSIYCRPFMKIGPPDVITHVNGCEPIRVSGASNVNISINIDNSVHTTNVRESNTRVDAKIGIGDAAIRFLSSLLG